MRNSLILLLLFCLPHDASPKDTAARPNILFIAVDDLRTSLRCYGDQLAKTPNIDRFARTARQFNRAYVQQAVCGPSRTSLLTGLLPEHSQVWHNRNRFRETRPHHVTLPQLFKQNGYHTIGLGKVFSGNERELDPDSWSVPETLRRSGWRNYVLPENQGKAKKQAAFESADVADDAYPDGKLANLAIKNLKALARNETPFFLAVGFFKPHLPFNAPRQYWDLHAPAAFELPPADREPLEFAPKLAFHTHRELGGYKGIPKNEQLDPKQTRLLRHGYYACVSYVDALVGRLLDALTELNLRHETIVILWGDHGFSLGESNRWCKATNFERDTRVPLIIRTPQLQRPGVSTDALVEMVDLYPTLAELANVASPKNLDGDSFAPLFTDPLSDGREVALSQFNRPWESSKPQVMGYSIRAADVRYTQWVRWQSREVVAEELYDYSSEESTIRSSALSLEKTNVASTQTGLLERMRNQMDTTLANRKIAPTKIP